MQEKEQKQKKKQNNKNKVKGKNCLNQQKLNKVKQNEKKE